MPSSKERCREREKQRRAAQRAAAAAAATDRPAPRPEGRAPNNHIWDPPPPGTWRHFQTNEPYDAVAARRVVDAASHARRTASRRWARLNAARCVQTMFNPGFELSSVGRMDVKNLGDERCCFCDALLYPGEAVALKAIRRMCVAGIAVPRARCSCGTCGATSASASSGATTAQKARCFASFCGSSTTPSRSRPRTTEVEQARWTGGAVLVSCADRVKKETRDGSV